MWYDPFSCGLWSSCSPFVIRGSDFWFATGSCVGVSYTSTLYIYIHFPCYPTWSQRDRYDPWLVSSAPVCCLRPSSGEPQHHVHLQRSGDELQRRRRRRLRQPDVSGQRRWRPGRCLREPRSGRGQWDGSILPELTRGLQFPRCLAKRDTASARSDGVAADEKVISDHWLFYFPVQIFSSLSYKSKHVRHWILFSSSGPKLQVFFFDGNSLHCRQKWGILLGIDAELEELNVFMVELQMQQSSF